MRKLATDQAGLEILHLGDMFRLLATAAIGRIGFMADDEVAVLPVRFLRQPSVSGGLLVVAAGLAYAGLAVLVFAMGLRRYRR